MRRRSRRERRRTTSKSSLHARCRERYPIPQGDRAESFPSEGTAACGLVRTDGSTTASGTPSPSDLRTERSEIAVEDAPVAVELPAQLADAARAGAVPAADVRRPLAGHQIIDDPAV